MLPDAETRSATVAALNTDVETLTNAQENLGVGPVKAMLEATIATLVLVRDEMIEDDTLVELAQRCASACLVLRNVAKGRGVGALSEPAQKAIASLEKIVHHIQSEVAEHAPGANFLPGHLPGTTEVFFTLWKAELQKVLEDVDRCMEAENALVSNENRQRAQPPAGTLPPPIVITQSDVDLSASAELADSGEQALQRLISGAIPQEELVVSIEAVFSSEKVIEMVNDLQRNEAEVFVEAVDEVLERPDFPAHIRSSCLKSLYRVCAGHSLLPRSLQIELGDSLTGAAFCHGGYGDVWKRKYRGQQVAVKVLKMYSNKDLRKVTRRFCKEFITWKSLRHPNVLPLLGVIMSKDQFAMVSEWMPHGDINQFVKAHEDADRYRLLGGVTKGLIYMHEQGMAHGDLKGANILVDENGHALLADFGLLAIIPDTANLISSTSFTEAGTFRWMSPELLDPERFDLQHSRPTKRSDCYALGMVIYEVLSGKVPFYRHGRFAAVARILEGVRPERPQGAEGAWFTDEIWSVLERCWKATASDRPRTAEVLLSLEKVSGSWSPSQTTPLYSSAHENTDKSEVSSPPHAVTAELSSGSPSVGIVARESHDPVVPRGIVETASSGDGEVRVRLQTPSGSLYKSCTNAHQVVAYTSVFFFF